MLPVESRLGGHARLRRMMHPGLGTMRACLVRMRRVRGLMLRIRRLGRRHAILVHGRPAIVPRATRAVGHQRV